MDVTDEQREILKQTIIEDDKPQSALSKKLLAQKKAKNKKRNIRIVLLIIFSLIGYGVWFLFKPFKASEEYGICRSLLELFVPYPYSIYVSELKILRDGSIKLWYTHTDAFGGYRLEEFQCKLLKNEKTGILELSEIKMHKVYLEADKIKSLNSSLVYFIEHPMVLNWPLPLPDSISALQLDFNVFRRIQIDGKR